MSGFWGLCGGVGGVPDLAKTVFCGCGCRFLGMMGGLGGFAMARGSIRSQKLTEEAVMAFIAKNGGPCVLRESRNENDGAARLFQREFSVETMWKAFSDKLSYREDMPNFTAYEYVRQLIAWWRSEDQKPEFRLLCGRELRRLQMVCASMHSSFEFVGDGASSKRVKAKAAAGEGADLDRAFRDSLKKVV